MAFADRVDAGRQLADRLDYLRGEPVVVLGLPRGGVPVAAQVAAALGAPLDVVIARKIGVPFQPELGMGAVAEDGVLVADPQIMAETGVSESDFDAVLARERAHVAELAARYRAGRSAEPLRGRVAVVVDDGIATGATARAACRVARARGAERVVLAVPVAPRGWQARIGADADEMVCVDTPPRFFAIGQFYSDFRQETDEDVIACLAGARPGQTSDGQSSDGQPSDGPADAGRSGEAGAAWGDVEVAAGKLRLPGYLTVPAGARGVVVFAHGSGSSRHSTRNQYVAGVLTDAGLGTLLFDLLTPGEELDRSNVFDISLLADRLLDVTSWLSEEPAVAQLPVGYFGASTGAAAALWAAAEPGAGVGAVVSRGGRPDLAHPRLALVTAPTLLIVGGADHLVLELNRQAQAELRCENELAVVPGATHLFEEPGTLDDAAALARDWFVSHLARG